MDDFEFHAFDSFQGLPETDEADGYFEEGTFDTSQADFVSIVKRRTGKLLAGDSIHSGFYVDSLTTELQARLPKIGVLHVDVDLYSSTVELLDFVEPLLCDGTVILFDDWYCFPLGTSGGEGLEVEHFLSKRQGIEMVPWKAYSTFGQSFFVKKSVSCSDSDG